MTFSLAGLHRTVDVLHPFEGADLAGLARTELLALQSAVADARRALDVVVAAVAGEIGRRSSVDDGPGGLARQQGFASPMHMVANALGSSLGQAGALVNVGQALAEADAAAASVSPDGTGGDTARSAQAVGPLAAALHAAQISVEKADRIATTLRKLTGDTTTIERELVAAAKRLTVAQLARVCANAAARHDRAGLRERDRRLHAERSVTVREDPSGMTIITAHLDPASAAPVLTLLDAQVKDWLQAKRENTDERTAAQMRADALAMVARHCLGCDQPNSGPTTTVIVRTTRAELANELGIGECDALGQPISSEALRMMAVDMEILPIVMGGKSEPLDVGRAKRLYSKPQRLAILERDGGCSWCHAPPSWCITHHIQWWSWGGLTNMDNAVALCTTCHNRVHRDGWGITVRDDQVWFTPPEKVDPTRTPRLGGKAHLGIA